ncbi:hypothetical protein [Flavobacterium humi]|uniref:Lipoprotein n=1 Tax=Flavobacterium humi TaxID=2562683 RepID=A0A4Z0LBX9_9FLAO|nr:hypothetical protein [Flavobacterium humi]TGD59377.1 hypothetical protein E4635_00110 [Flavobacterium humi]
MAVKNYILGILLVFISSCKHSENKAENETILTENYSLEVPNDMERAYTLNELAKVQFQKVEEDLYFIVLEETKESFENAIRLKVHHATPSLFGYYKVVTNHFDEIYKDLKINDFGTTKINSCNAIVFSMSGKDLGNGKNVFFRYALLEDNKNLYQIMSWTNIHYKDKLIGKMEGIINSFKSESSSR